MTWSDPRVILRKEKKYNTRELDRVMVKGRKTPLNIHEVFNGDNEEKIKLKLDFLDTQYACTSIKTCSLIDLYISNSG